MTLLRRSIATVATASVALLTFPAAPALALDGPVARPDNFSKDGRGVVTGNVLANDSWDAAHTATLTKVDVLSTEYIDQDGGGGTGENPAPATYTMSPNGDISVDFGPYTYSGVERSRLREATLRYEFTDSAGQRSVELARFRDANAVADTALVDDTNLSMTGNDTPDTAQPGWSYPLDVYANDTLGYFNQYTFEIVTQPAAGSISPSMRYTVPNTPGSYTEVFTYRVCAAGVPGTCTAPAQVTWKVNVVAPPVQPGSVNENKAFWMGGPTSYTFDPVASARAAAYLEPDWLPPGTTASLRPAARDHIVVSDLGDGTFRYAYAGEFPAAIGAPMVHETPLVFELRNTGGGLIGYYQHAVSFVPPLAYGAEAPLVRDDDAWVKVGTTFNIPVPFANDVRPTGVGATVDEWIGAPADFDPKVYPRLLSQPQLGDLHPMMFDPQMGWVDKDASPMYRAHDVAGLDVVRYQLCAPYPGRTVECSDGVMRIHVSPEVTAVNDQRTARPGDTLVVPVLGNDIYTDIPAKDADVLVLTDVPTGVRARVLDDRNVEVKVPAGFEGDAFDFGYRLSDFTGTTTARVVVNIERDTPDVPDPVTPEPPVVVDPPVDEPEPDPEPEPEPVVPPKARNDHGEVEVGGKVTLDAFDNDTYQGEGEVVANGWTGHGSSEQKRLAKRGEGWKATATRDGKLTVDVSPAFNGDRIRFRYRLTDETGESDTAVVTVKVIRPVAVPPIIPAGGVFDLDGIHPKGDTTTKAAASPVAAVVAPVAGGQVLAMLTGWALLALVGAALYRRKARVS